MEVKLQVKAKQFAKMGIKLI